MFFYHTHFPIPTDDHHYKSQSLLNSVQDGNEKNEHYVTLMRIVYVLIRIIKNKGFKPDDQVFCSTMHVCMSHCGLHHYIVCVQCDHCVNEPFSMINVILLCETKAALSTGINILPEHI
jgi:hypothetical protein